MDNGLVEAVVYAARKLHWNREEIGALTPAQFSEIVEELRYQEAVERYELLQIFATLLSVIHNAPISKPRIMKPKDFLKLEPPMRKSEMLKKKIAENRPDIEMPKYKLVKEE
jgi:hypothetical protein